MLLTESYYSFKYTLLYDINRYFSRKDIDNISVFLEYIKNIKNEDYYIRKEDIENYIKNLTIENYKIFIIQLDSKKYNI